MLLNIQEKEKVFDLLIFTCLIFSLKKFFVIAVWDSVGVIRRIH
jgi:hypothetical protein